MGVPSTLSVSRFIEDLPMAAAVFDRSMRFLATNAPWRRILAKAPGELEGHVYYDLFPGISDEHRAIHRRCLEGEAITREIEAFPMPSGKTFYISWSAKPWRDDDGAIGGLLMFADDVTERVTTARRLDERESAIRQFFAQSPVGLNLCRMDGLWLESNPAFLRLIGYDQAEADGGLTYWQLTPRTYDADEAAQLEQLRTTRRYGPYEKEFIRKDGTLVPVRLNGFLVERDGETLIWSLIEDMTEQRVLEKQLEEERVKAVQSSKLAMLGQMAAGVAHELNNPLAIIELFAFGLKRSVEKNDLPAADEAIEAIRSAVSRAGRIVRGLSSFSRPTHGERILVPMVTVIEDALSLCRHRFATDGVQLRMGAMCGASVVCHPSELSQVLVNLLNNASDAAKATKDPWVRVACVEDGDRVEVRVEDSGGPLPEDVADKLFRPFFTTKKVGEGTGLGLSICRTIVDRHGGSLALAPDAPHTTFVLRLPRGG